MTEQINNDKQYNDGTNDDYEAPDDSYKKIVSQINDEERLYSLYTEMKDYCDENYIPLLNKLNIEDLSEFVTPKRLRVY